MQQEAEIDWFATDVQARMEAQRIRTIRRLATAFSKSPAIIVDRNGPELWIWSGDMIHGGRGVRVSLFDEDGPYSHVENDTADEMLDELVRNLDYYQTDPVIIPATDEDVIAWTASESFVAGSKRLEFRRLQNHFSMLAMHVDYDWKSEVDDLIMETYSKEGIDAAIEMLREAVEEARGRAR